MCRFSHHAKATLRVACGWVDNTSLFSCTLHASDYVNHTTWLKCLHSHASPHIHAIDDERLSVCSLLSLRSDSLRVSLLLTLLFPCHCYLYVCPELLLPCGQRQGNHTLRSPPTEESCPLAEFTPPTGYEPKHLDNFDYSETSAMIFQDETGDTHTDSSYSCDAELDDEIIGKAQFSPLFIRERQEQANLRQAYHSHQESLLPSIGRPVYELSSCPKRKIKSRNGERKNQDSP